MERTAIEEATGGTIVLTPETNMRLRAVAARAGEPAEDFADALLTEALAEYEDVLAGVERGLAAAAAGNETDFEAFVAQRQAKRQQRAGTTAL